MKVVAPFQYLRRAACAICALLFICAVMPTTAGAASSSFVTTVGRYAVIDSTTSEILRNTETTQFVPISVDESINGNSVQASVDFDFESGPTVSGGVAGPAEIQVHILGQSLGSSGGTIGPMSNIIIQTGGELVATGFVADGDSLVLDMGFLFSAVGVPGFGFGGEYNFHENIVGGGAFERRMAIPETYAALFPTKVPPGFSGSYTVSSSLMRQLYFFSNYEIQGDRQSMAVGPSASAVGGSYATITSEGFRFEIAQVPEPSSFALLAGAVTTIGLYRVRLQRARRRIAVG